MRYCWTYLGASACCDICIIPCLLCSVTVGREQDWVNLVWKSFSCGSEQSFPSVPYFPLKSTRIYGTLISHPEEMYLTAVSLGTLAAHKRAFNKQLQLQSLWSDTSLCVSLCSSQKDFMIFPCTRYLTSKLSLLYYKGIEDVVI